MQRLKKQLVTWRLGVILAVGSLLGLGLGRFSDYVARMDDSPNGVTPISWTFKAQSRKVPEFFSGDRGEGGGEMEDVGQIPAVDRTMHTQTESALFALG